MLLESLSLRQCPSIYWEVHVLRDVVVFTPVEDLYVGGKTSLLAKKNLLLSTTFITTELKILIILLSRSYLL